MAESTGELGKVIDLDSRRPKESTSTGKQDQPMHQEVRTDAERRKANNERFFKRLDKSAENYQKQQRKLQRRSTKKRLGAKEILVAGGIVAAGVATAAAIHHDQAIDAKAREQLSVRPTTTQILEAGKSKEAAVEIPTMFLPGKTYIDLTKVNIRTSPIVIDGPDNSNQVDKSKLFDKSQKTLIDENAKLVEGYDGNGYWMSLDLPSKDDGDTKTYFIDYSVNKGESVISQAEKTGESGFIERDGNNGGYHGSIPKLNGKPTIVSSSQMSNVSFSSAPFSSFLAAK